MSQPNRGDKTLTEMQETDDGGRRNKAAQSVGRSSAEWATLAISAGILFAILGLITYLNIRGEDNPASIAVETSPEEIRHEGGLYYLPVEVTNEGNRTAEDVLIEAELVTGSSPPQTAEFTINFLAGGERVRGTFIFTDDPSAGELTARALGFKDP